MYSECIVRQAALLRDMDDARESIDKIMASVVSSSESFTIDDVNNVMYILDLVEVHGIGNSEC